MTLQLLAATFEDSSLGLHGARTDEGSALSLLFDSLMVESAAADVNPTPEVRRAEGVVQCAGSGWVSVQLRGATAVAGGHGFAHALGWANGRRLRALETAEGEPFCISVAAPVAADGLLRLSLLLLAQRDLADANSAAACWVDSIDMSVLTLQRRQPGARK